jgi:hypothetical protein
VKNLSLKCFLDSSRAKPDPQLRTEPPTSGALD